MKVLITSLSFQSLTGSEMYVYELSRELAAAGHEVTIMSQTGGEIAQRAAFNGVQVIHFQQAPFVRLAPDIVHLNQPQPSQAVLVMVPGVPAVQTVHSEADCESPVIDPRVRKYICIRPSIQKHLLSSHGIRVKSTSVIYNPIDFSRFRPDPARGTHERRRVVFVGTIDRMRRPSILHLVDRSVKEDFDLLIVGQRVEPYLDGLRLANVQVLPPAWNVEEYLVDADETAGVLLGRTTIEGWACGKAGWIYDVDDRGEIRSVKLEQPPKDMSEFDSRGVAVRVVKLYETVLGR